MNGDHTAPRSPRGLPLVRSGGYVHEPVLTVEFHCKWYSLFLIMPNGDVRAVPFGALEDYVEPGVSAYVDHAPNPFAVQTYAERHGYILDELAEELIIGRWELEAQGNYQ